MAHQDAHQAYVNPKPAGTPHLLHHPREVCASNRRVAKATAQFRRNHSSRCFLSESKQRGSGAGRAHCGWERVECVLARPQSPLPPSLQKLVKILVRARRLLD